ncbi:peptide-methionine (S)-S-oxide reductase MsrA [Eubacteriales bacterium OttesenSCG-928-N14]|nr:peptide-methionine (S)-S-oxide reductase MsrA [Eubacteriales bacterium OttesenSCG-928-N14]
MNTIYLAGGCFWGVEAYIMQLGGVVHTKVGYANSNTPNPSYELVCTGTTGATETVKVDYDAKILPLSQLLDAFFLVIDPTTLNRQGPDAGTQYRSGIYYVDEADAPVITSAIARVQAQYNQPVVTEVMALGNFYPAEEYHQHYLQKNPGGYCHIDLSKAKEQ